MRVPLPIIGGTSESRSININNQRSINMRPRMESAGAKTPAGMYQVEGLEYLQVLGTGPCRSNGIQFGSSTYFVSGAELVAFDSDYAGSTIGTINTSTSRCEGVSGRSYLMLVDGTNGYTYDGTTFAQIADADFPNGATHVCYLDGYFIVNNPGTDEYYISANEDPTSWVALDFGTAENQPDEIKAVAANTKELYLIGDKVSEIHYDSGNPDFPFEAYPGGVVEIGIRSPHSLVTSAFGLFFIAHNKDGDAFVVNMNGAQYQIISDLDTTKTINELSVTSDAYGSLYRRKGETFYVLTFPGADKTLVFDVSTRIWHERKSRNIGRWQASGIGFVGEKHIVGNYNTGKFFTLSEDVHTEDGEILERTRQCQIFHSNGNRIDHKELELVIQSGVGLTTGQGSDPLIMMDYSDDFGRTFSSELTASMGKKGEYETRLIWDKLGDAVNRIYRFKVTDPVNLAIVGAYLDATELQG